MSGEAVLLHVPRVIVLIACCVLTPLALRAAGMPKLSSLAWKAGGLAGGALFLSTSAVTAYFSIGYTIVCMVAGYVGVRRLLVRWNEPPQLAMGFALVGLAGASVWLLAYNAGHALLGYPPLWVLLTAAHFHVAGCFLPLVVGWCAERRGPPARLVAIGCVVGVPLTAAGIAVGQPLELAGAIVMAASGVGAAVVLVTTSSGSPAIAVVRLAAVPLAIGMLLAGAYALREHGTAVALFGLDPLSTMLVTHAITGTLFALLALGAIVKIGHRIHGPPVLSRLRGRWPVRADFFAREKLEMSPRRPPTGLVDKLENLGITTAAPAIRDFYEHTGAHELVVAPRWRPGFRTGGRIWAAIARRMGQLQLPVATDTGGEGVASRIVAIDDRVDGRPLPRAWIRTYPDGRALYVAAYATHVADEQPYMNIAFPVPGGQLSSILRMDDRGTGVRVTTKMGGDCGIWLVLLGVPIRLPLAETIDVWTVDDPVAPESLRRFAQGYTTMARHTLWLCGIRYLELDYAMRRADMN